MEKEATKQSKLLKQIIFIVFLLALLLPAAQKQFGLIKERELGGFFNTVDFPEFDCEKWNSGEYQTTFDAALNDNVGFHNSLVRLQSQLNYSIFKVSKIQSVVVGNGGHLFQTNYIEGYTGNRPLGKRHIELQIEKAKVVARELKKKNIDLVFALAPGKGSYCSEFIPERYKKLGDPDSSNYSLFRNAIINADLNFIDLRGYFLKIKDTIKQPLFSQVGVHWGQYASYFAADTIVHYIENLKNIQMKDFYVSKLEFRDSLIKSDQDASILMNTLVSPTFYKMPYSQIAYKNTDSIVKPRLLSVSDSYFSNIVATGIIDSVFGKWDYWVYFRDPNKKNEGYSLKDSLEKNDVILLLATDGTLGTFPYGFIDNVYELYAPKDKAYYALQNKYFQNYIKQVMANIEEGKEWKRQLVKTAKRKRISETDEFLNNALWLYNTRQ